MLKIPSFILGGILILTGLISYIVQDPSLSIKITGPWASDAEFLLSDGDQEVMLNFDLCDSAGENAWKIVHYLNEGHAKDINDNNSRSSEGDPESFWYASSSGNTLKAILQESENYSNAGTDNYEPIAWSEIDVEKAKIRFIYNNMGDSVGPVTLTSTNWENVLNAPENGEALEFGKSWTAFIPGIIGLILILLAVAADKAPNAKKHIMHVAVLIALLGFLSIAKMVFGAFAEMSWWRSEPYLIYEASSLKPTSMLLSAGLLLIYVILCVVSFISARKEMAAQAARDAAKKAAVLKKAAKRKPIDDEPKPKDGKDSAEASKNKAAPTKDLVKEKPAAEKPVKKEEQPSEGKKENEGPAAVTGEPKEPKSPSETKKNVAAPADSTPKSDDPPTAPKVKENQPAENAQDTKDSQGTEKS